MFEDRIDKEIIVKREEVVHARIVAGRTKEISRRSRSSHKEHEGGQRRLGHG